MYTEAHLEGIMLTSEEAQVLEKQLESDPDHLINHLKLFSFYTTQVADPDSYPSRYKHVLWIFKNHPVAAQNALLMLMPGLDDAIYPQGKEIWLNHLALNPDDPHLLLNASNFFILWDKNLAEELLKKGKQLYPEDPRWPKALGDFYSLQNERSMDLPVSPREEALLELKSLEEHKAAMPQGHQDDVLLIDLAKSAFEAGDMEKAEKYAQELLQLSLTHDQKDWNYGNIIHHGNSILGQVALASGDLAQSKEYLLQAGATHGSPQLDTFGPNMALAKRLLEKGEQEIVLQYLDQCSRFWEMGEGQLKQWKDIISTGEIPEFGPNLIY